MGAYDRLQPGLFIMRQGDRESKWHGHGPAPEYKGETAIHAMTMPPFYIIAQLKYTGTGFTKQTSRVVVVSEFAVTDARARRRAIPTKKGTHRLSMPKSGHACTFLQLQTLSFAVQPLYN